MLKHYNHHDFPINCPLPLLAFYKNQSWPHREKDPNAIDRDVQKADPLKSLLCKYCKNYLLPTASQPAYTKVSGWAHCPAQFLLQGPILEWWPLFCGPWYYIKAQRYMTESEHHSGNKGLKIEVLKAIGEDTLSILSYIFAGRNINNLPSLHRWLQRKSFPAN